MNFKAVLKRLHRDLGVDLESGSLAVIYSMQTVLPCRDCLPPLEHQIRIDAKQSLHILAKFQQGYLIQRRLELYPGLVFMGKEMVLVRH